MERKKKKRLLLKRCPGFFVPPCSLFLSEKKFFSRPGRLLLLLFFLPFAKKSEECASLCAPPSGPRARWKDSQETDPRRRKQKSFEWAGECLLFFSATQPACCSTRRTGTSGTHGTQGDRHRERQGWERGRRRRRLTNSRSSLPLGVSPCYRSNYRQTPVRL